MRRRAGRLSDARDPLVEVLQRYLRSRAARFPRRGRHSPTAGDTLDVWPARAPLFVGVDGQRITRDTVQYRVLRALKGAGLHSHKPYGALVHALRHTYATALAQAGAGRRAARETSSRPREPVFIQWCSGLVAQRHNNRSGP